ncbi:hypothetical protein B0J18DRAFT_259260 [Chaetomium sp. MPI-SDFR-AT-0129]|nr:hypothetical protein B0J18DRAFT_259260 [Chaetomium sp. MPI-SDFR-AT-0129]
MSIVSNMTVVGCYLCTFVFLPLVVGQPSPGSWVWNLTARDLPKNEICVMMHGNPAVDSISFGIAMRWHGVSNDSVVRQSTARVFRILWVGIPMRFAAVVGIVCVDPLKFSFDTLLRCSLLFLGKRGFARNRRNTRDDCKTGLGRADEEKKKPCGHGVGDHNGFVSGSYLERASRLGIDGVFWKAFCVSHLSRSFLFCSFIQAHKSLLD